MLLDTPDKYYKALTLLAAKFDHGIITSFGLFCGILHDYDFSSRIPSRDRDFLNSVANHKNLTVVIGTADYFSPGKNKGCDDCVLSYTKRMIRIEKHRELFPNIKWKILSKLHSKVAVFWNEDNKVAIIGSRNFTGSENMEMSILVKDQDTTNELHNYCNYLVGISTNVDLDIMIKTTIEETGSDRCMSLLCGEI